ncbi:ATP-grasp domain-containing protein [Aspergillus insuetus]
MVDLEFVDAGSAVCFYPSEPEKLLRPLAVDLNTEGILHAIFTNAVGGLLLRPVSIYNDNVTDYESIFQSLDFELTNRLSFPWLTHSPPPPRTLAIVEGGRSSPSHGGTATSIYTAARALNISMIVLDVAGHWLEGPEYADWRKYFLPIQLEPPSLLRDRTLDALFSSGHKVDALVTFCDSYQVPVSQAAEKLGLPTASAEAFEVATDKYRTGVFEGRLAFLVRSVEEALGVLQRGELEYPFIVKPCKGFLSEGVFKIHGPDELASGIMGVNLDRHGAEFVLEAYCDGPEVDINFVLSKGELLFCEVSDDFPKTADANHVSSKREGEKSQQQQLASFVELGNVLPSNLPLAEIEVLRESLHRSLVRLGLKTGIFHLEARVQNSSVEYGVISSSSSSDTAANPIIDLIPCSTPVNEKPSAWLIEINPRPPGIQETAAVESTYGIDYWGIGLLSALRDHARLRSLSHPFLQGPQYWSEMVFIPVTRGGIFDSDDVCADLIERRPDLGKHVSRSFCFLKRGDIVVGPEEGVTGWVAYFVVFSRVSRAELLRLSREIRAEVSIRVV